MALLPLSAVKQPQQRLMTQKRDDEESFNCTINENSDPYEDCHIRPDTKVETTLLIRARKIKMLLSVLLSGLFSIANASLVLLPTKLHFLLLQHTINKKARTNALLPRWCTRQASGLSISILVRLYVCGEPPSNAPTLCFLFAFQFVRTTPV